MSETSERDPQEVLRRFMTEHGLKGSRQRDLIVDVFLTTAGHLTVEELLERVRAQDARVSQATVYRTMRLLTDCGLAHPRNFFDGQTRYEIADWIDQHHDHLICSQCGCIVEFVDPRIEELQAQVAASHGFEVTRHKLELYGLCSNCR